MLGTALLLQVLAAGIAAGTQVVLQPPPPLASLASPEYNSFLDDVRRNASIPGVSVAVVRLGQDKEPVVQLATSGRKTEDGDGHDLTVDVRRMSCIAILVAQPYYIDPLRTRIMLKSFPRDVSGYSHGRLCARA